MKRIISKIKQSPINYFSDLFVITMVVAFLITIIVMLVMGCYSTIINRDNSIWSDLGVLVAVPVSAGGAVWMIKNSIQHWQAGKHGETCEPDFPDDESDELDDELEEISDEEM